MTEALLYPPRSWRAAERPPEPKHLEAEVQEISAVFCRAEEKNTLLEKPSILAAKLPSPESDFQLLLENQRSE